MVTNTDNNAASGSAETREAVLWERIGRLEERVEKSEKSIWRKIGIYGGLIALVLSIASGSYNLVDVLLFKPSEATERKSAKISDISFKLNSFRQQIQVLVSAGDITGATAAAKALNLAKSLLLVEAKKILTDGDVPIDVPSLLLFSEEFFGTDIEYSEKLANRAVEISLKKYELAESLAYLAQIIMFRGEQDRVEQSRRIFRDALAKAKDSEDGYKADVILDVLGKWATSEMYHGACSEAEDIVLSMPSVANLTIDDFRILSARKLIRQYTIRINRCTNVFSK
jgi:hypothetical protein